MGAYQRFMRNPTRLAPPVPAQYPFASFTIFEGSKCIERIQCASDQSLSATDQPVSLQIGEIGLAIKSDGIAQLNIGESGLGASLIFRPRFGGAMFEKQFPAAQGGKSDHFWLIAAPLCEVSGEMHIGGSTGTPARTIAFSGLGYRDHLFGSGPAKCWSDCWVRGRILEPRRAIAFQWWDGRRGGAPAECMLVEADENGIRQLATAIRPQAALTASGAVLNFGERLRLVEPRILGSWGGLAHTLYQSGEGPPMALCQAVGTQTGMLKGLIAGARRAFRPDPRA